MQYLVVGVLVYLELALSPLLHSEKEAGDAKKHEEIELREQKNKERLSNDGTGTTIAKQLQEESISRMSQHSLPIGLPKTVSMRDDPLTKAQAFLNEVPTID